MIHKCRAISVANVDFKRPLSTAITVNPISQHRQNNDPHYLNDEFLHLGPIRTHFLSSYLFSNALKKTAKSGSFLEVQGLHGCLYKSGLYNVLSLQNQLLHLYVKCKEFHCACNLFDEIPVKNIVTWNMLLCGVANCGAGFRSFLNLGFYYFKNMLSEMVGPDCITFTSLLRMGIELNDIEIGRQLHCFILKVGLCAHCFVSSALIDFYSTYSLVGDARSTFYCCLEKDLVLWNVMMSCYISNGLEKEAILFFSLMRLEDVRGDGFTFSNFLNASAILGFPELGKQIHSLIIRLSFDVDVVVASTLVDMYAKNKNIKDARKAFDGLVFRNIISWNTMIVGCGQHGDGNEAVKLLGEMFREDMYPDELTLASVLSSCGNLSSFTEIVQIHAYALKIGLQAVLSIANSLINAYSKCGRIVMACKCFSSIAEPDIVSWTSIIRAYAFHGLPRKGIELFDKMRLSGKRPDRVAFLGVLSACSHGGLVDAGLHYFNLMTSYYNIEPHSEHYTCLIDLLGRAGLLDEAFNVLTSLPFESGSDILGAFIGACKVHGNSELAKWAAEKLFLLEPGKHVNYAILSNIYASVGCWVDVARVRKMMRDRCSHKVPGCSWIEISGDIHTFVSNDKSHPRALQIYELLEVLVRVMEQEDCLFSVEVEETVCLISSDDMMIYID